MTDSTTRTERAGLSVDDRLLDYIENDVLPAAGLSADAFWRSLAATVAELGPRGAALLAERDRLQAQLDQWYRANPGVPTDLETHLETHKAFLGEIGYLQPEPEPFQISTEDVDVEIAHLAGPQLVVPVTNARFALNAANARWGSLYDAVYGSDLIADGGETAKGAGYNPARGAVVVAMGRELLDMAAPLTAGSHAQATSYAVSPEGALVVSLEDGTTAGLVDAAAFAGYTGDAASPASVLFVHHGLHLDVLIDPSSPVGALDAAGVADIVLEAAVTTIMDLEDSVSAVDAEDKVQGYSVWQGLLSGELTVTFQKGGRPFTRSMNADRTYTAPDGSTLTLHGRSLMLVRNVGIHMYTDAVRDAAGDEIPEGFLDAFVTAAAAIPNLRQETTLANTRTGSLYIVKPKQHGPAEVAFTVELFGRVENALGLAPRTLKIGIMDEERRTSLNLDAAIAAASDRVVFINTGFLDRTGDEIHTSMEAGAFRRKGELKGQPNMVAYENANVDAGLAHGLPGRAQIGKGMWAMPDLMKDMYETKSAQLRAGATTAWVPSPTAATIHAVHYHQVDVAAVQAELRSRPRADIDEILRVPLDPTASWSAEEIATELDNNVQSILGYVVRWVDQGVGCSKVPDLEDVGLMEDRATLRISSQLLANWLRHDVITRAQVDEALARISPIVDRQNAGDASYRPLVADDGTESLSFQAARDLIVDGADQPNGYTEFILHRYRRAQKNADRA
ncbi:malate synthase G [Microbacterium sp. bgisy203]|uniref:malate synthase G n=1 Tax=Microbacterium sp. bgisy203 TaxID=3413799 RepID=UPI003D75D8BB